MVCREEGHPPHNSTSDQEELPRSDANFEVNDGSEGSSIVREEEVLVLYGSQRGTAERAAEEIAESLPRHLSAEALGGVKVRTTLMSMDDFLLEERQGRWTRATVIVASSFGCGDAPRNARRFRKLCQGWLREFGVEKDGFGNEAHNQPSPEPFLVGLHFAVLGFGDSYYKTFQKNPTVIEEALLAAGATRMGERGVVDSERGDDENRAAVQAWTEELYDNLTRVVVQKPLSEDALDMMQKHTERSI